MWQFQPLSNPIFSENTRDRNSFSLLKCTNRMHARSNCSMSWTWIKKIMQNNLLDWTIVRWEILVVVTIKNVTMWDVIPCSLVMNYKQSIKHSGPADSNLWLYGKTISDWTVIPNTEQHSLTPVSTMFTFLMPPIKDIYQFWPLFA